MIKAALIIERADISLGGGERSVFELTEALQAVGVDAHIVAAKGIEQKSSEKIHILCSSFPNKRVPFFTYEKALKSFVAENKFDVLHSVLPFDFADIYQPRGGSYPESIARNAASYENKFVEIYKKATAFVNIRRMRLHRAERRLCLNPKGAVIAAISNYVAEQFIKHYHLPRNRITVIPNGVKTDIKIDMQTVESIRLKLLSGFGLRSEDRPIVLLFAANNFRLKGLKELIEAMNEAVKSCKSVYLIVAGRGEKRGYVKLAQRFGIDRRIIFLGRVDNIKHYLAAADVAVLPTYYDPSSRFTLEAIAAGKPVITTSYNGASELIVHNRHGLVIDRPDNIKVLADAISFFADERQIKRFSGAITADKLIDKVSISCASERLCRLYEKIIEQKRR